MGHPEKRYVIIYMLKYYRCKCLARYSNHHTDAFINSISDIAIIKGYTNNICYTAKALVNVKLPTPGAFGNTVQELVKKLNDVTTPTCSASRY